MIARVQKAKSHDWPRVWQSGLKIAVLQLENHKFLELCPSNPHWIFMTEYAVSPVSVLIDLYIRLRDELENCRRCLDPNDGIRASVAMAVLQASVLIPNDIDRIEEEARRLLRGRDAAARLTITKSRTRHAPSRFNRTGVPTGQFRKIRKHPADSESSRG